MKLTVEQQVDLMGRVWGERDPSGYVFLPWILGSCKTKEERRDNFHEGEAFLWPQERDKIIAHLKLHQANDLYWCPSPFEQKRRVEPYAMPETALWADLDEVDPREIESSYRPTIAWETSPGRYQGIWLLIKEVVGASWQGRENHRLTTYLGADPSGWDTTQLLRVPGWKNHKPEWKQKYGKPVQGHLLWKTGEKLDPHWLAKNLPEVQVLSIDEDVLDQEVEQVDRHKVWARVRLKVSKQVRQYMALRELPDKGEGSTQGRSGVLWQIERDLADAGCTLSEIVAIVRASVWNKYRGRNDELKRLRIEAAKALQETTTHKQDTLEEVAPPKGLVLFTGPQWGKQPKVKWLVKDIWREGSCGFLAGDPKSYKSWIALDLAISIASGKPFLGKFPVTKQGPVIFIEEEDRQRELEDRATAIFNIRDPKLHPYGAFELSPDGLFWLPSTPLPLWVSVGQGFIASDPADQGYLKDWIAEYNAVFVIIDTLGTTAGEVDVDRGVEVLNKILNPLKDISRTHNCAIGIVHHNRKSAEGNGGRRMLGSHHLYGWTDDALFFGTPSKRTITVERSSKAADLGPLAIEVPRMSNLSQGGGFWLPHLGGEESEDTSFDKPNAEINNGLPGLIQLLLEQEIDMTLLYTTREIAEILGKSISSVSSQLSRLAQTGWARSSRSGQGNKNQWQFQLS